jgi:hypothetical protein
VSIYTVPVNQSLGPAAVSVEFLVISIQIPVLVCSGVGGGSAPVRAYIEELLPDILESRIEPGKVFDRNVGLDGVPDGYRAMADRESIKVMVTP